MQRRFRDGLRLRHDPAFSNYILNCQSSRFYWIQSPWKLPNTHNSRSDGQAPLQNNTVTHCARNNLPPGGRKNCVWNVMAHAQKPDFVFRRNGRAHLNRRGRQLSRLLAAEVWPSAVVMLDTPCSDAAWRVLATHSIRHCPFTSPPVRHRVPSHIDWTLTWATRRLFDRMPQPFDPPYFHRLSNIRRPVQTTKSLIMQFSPACSYCAPHCLNIPLNSLFSDLMIDQTSHPYKAKNITSVVYTLLWTF